MTQSGQKGFEGWYFKHQRGEEMVAFIPGRAESGPFLQMISPQGARQFAVSRLTVGGGMVRADRCWFSTRGCHIELPGVRGGIVYGPLSSLSCDIMGPFRFLPMECRHGVISMVHTLRGTLWIDGQPHRFDGGQGYIEKDRGISFPRWYLWVQCNDFSAPCSVMLSVAAVPLGPISFRGCICALLYRGRTYRFATYRGVRILRFSPRRVCLAQGRRLLDLTLAPRDAGHPLRAPQNGRMSGCIRESCAARMRLRLREDGKTVLDLGSARAAYEFVPPPQAHNPATAAAY